MRKEKSMLKNHSLPPLLSLDADALLICSGESMKSLKFPCPDFAPYLTCNEAEIKRRQLLFRDLLNHPTLFEILKHSLEKINNLAEICKKLGTVSGNNNETILYSLLELQFFTDALLTLHEGYREEMIDSLESDAWITFLRQIHRIVSDEQFTALKELLDDTDVKLRSIRSVTLGVNLDAQLNVKEAGIVSINEEPFVTASPLARLFGQDKPPRDFTCIASVGIQEIGGLLGKNRISLDQNFYSAMNTILQGSLRGLKRNLVNTVMPSIHTLLERKDELAFLIRGTEYLMKLQNAKLPLSYPTCSRTVRIRSLHNPLLLDKLTRQKIVPSDVTIDDKARLFVLTGPNSGGKTVYLTAVGLAQIFFQTGLPIPAQWAEMRIYRNIVTHFVKESVCSTESRLAGETVRLKNCLNNVTKESLLLLDEVFSSTSAYDAVFLAEALLGYLAKIGCHGIYVTHLHELAVKIREGKTDSCIRTMSARVTGGRRTYEITEAIDEEISTSLARDVVIENGLGFLFN